MQKVNHIALLIDRSDSTHGIAPEIIRQLNTQIELINRRSNEEGQKTHLSLYTFSDVADAPLLFDVPLDLVTIKPLTREAYKVDGMTALFDSVGRAIYDLAAINRDVKLTDDQGFLVMVFTDGGENNSKAYGVDKVLDMMREKIQTDMWTFTFLVPKGNKTMFVNRYGVQEGNVQEWNVGAGAAGVQQSFQTASQGLNNYFSARTKGVRSMSSMYTNLSQVTSQDLSKLADVTSGFKKKQVEKEIDIKTFCTYNFGEYVLGNAFYELMKPEKIQDHKKLAIEDKATGRIYGSDVVRQMLGLPAVGLVKVVPGNHANYRIYVQSTSVNRKLVRGTYLLYHKSVGVGA